MVRLVACVVRLIPVTALKTLPPLDIVVCVATLLLLKLLLLLLLCEFDSSALLESIILQIIGIVKAPAKTPIADNIKNIHCQDGKYSTIIAPIGAADATHINARIIDNIRKKQNGLLGSIAKLSFFMLFCFSCLSCCACSSAFFCCL